MRIQKLGESEIIKDIWRKIGRENENEDVHFLSMNDNYILLAMDTINENVHFQRDWDPAKVGKFLVDINMSDIISKNGHALEMMASFSFPRSLRYDWFNSFMEGLLKELDKFKVDYMGGDLKEGKFISLTGLIIGNVKKGEELRRRPIRPGEFIYISDKIGKQYLKYLDYRDGKGNGEEILDIDVSYEKIKNILSFKPTACMDDSDGPFKSLRILSEINGVKMNMAQNACISEDIEGCYSFGGDYELIFATEIYTDRFPLLAFASEGSGLYDKLGNRINLEGYEHFKFRRIK